MILETLIIGPFGVNCYILGCEKTKTAAVIDPGAEAEKIWAVIEKNNLSLQYILLTHAHVDHAGEVAKIQKLSSAPILMHQGDVFLLENLTFQAASFGLPDPGNPHPDRFVNENEQIIVGEIKLNVLHTPGHSPGGVAYLGPDMVFVGDTLFAGSIGRTDLPGGDYQTLIESVRTRLFTLADTTIVYPGHGPTTSIGQEKNSNPFFTSYQ